jgi:hypothetical protein
MKLRRELPAARRPSQRSGAKIGQVASSAVTASISSRDSVGSRVSFSRPPKLSSYRAITPAGSSTLGTLGPTYRSLVSAISRSPRLALSTYRTFSRGPSKLSKAKGPRGPKCTPGLHAGRRCHPAGCQWRIDADGGHVRWAGGGAAANGDGGAVGGLGDTDHRDRILLMGVGAETVPSLRVGADVTVHDRQVQRFHAGKDTSQGGQFPQVEVAGPVGLDPSQQGVEELVVPIDVTSDSDLLGFDVTVLDPAGNRPTAEPTAEHMELFAAGGNQGSERTSPGRRPDRPCGSWLGHSRSGRRDQVPGVPV